MVQHTGIPTLQGREDVNVVEPFWYTDDRPPSVNIIGGWIKAATEIHADYIPGASHWIDHHPEWMASDGLHPNDVGYAQIANRMDAALAGLGVVPTEVVCVA